MSNSKQMNFFIVPGDWTLIDRFTHEQKIIYLSNNALKNEDNLKNDLIVDNLDKAAQLYLTNVVFRNHVYFKKYERGYFIDVLKSNFIEFSRGGLYENGDNVLHRARLYAITKYFQGEEKIAKDAFFVSWANEFMKLFKKNFLLKTNLDTKILFSRNVVDWINEHGAKIHKSGLSFSFDL